MSSFSPINQASPEMEMSSVKMNLKNSFDSLIENKGDSMKVYCRVRPMLQIEEDSGYTECIAAIDDQVVRAVVPTSSMKFKNSSHNGQEIMEDFKYTLAFGPEVGQFSFFHETIMDILQGFIEGQNGLVFSYGITNSGKTYTLQGDDVNPGIIPLALHLFFACVEHQLLDGISVKPDKYSEIVVLNHNERAKEQELKEELLKVWDNECGNKSNASNSKSFGMTLCDAFYDNFKYEERKTTLPPEEMVAAQTASYMKELGRKTADEQAGLCSIWVSFIEIYNEFVYDLLQTNILQRQKLNLAEDQNGDVYVKGAKEIFVSSSEEAIKLLHLGRRNLRIASTKLNYQSSRSHCIFTLKVVRLFDEQNSSCGRVSRISFCDLAGSERAAKSQTSGLRLKEAGYINTSLLVLGRCLDQLRLNQTSREKKMIPYRESKLTRLFYSHFLGRGKATMIANVSPCEQTFDETFNVLRFSALAKELTINDGYISMASNSIQNLTTQWGRTRGRSSADVFHNQSSDFDDSLSAEIQEKDDIIEKLFKVADDLQDNLKKEKKEKAELEIVLREEICNEFSALSDQLIKNQKNISEQRIEGVKKNYQVTYDNMVKMYEEKIHELMAQLQEIEQCAEESINESLDQENEASMSRSNLEAKYLQSPKSNLFEEKQEACEEEIFEKSECTSSEHEKLISENRGLKLDLSALKKELEYTTKQLQEYTVMIVQLQDGKKPEQSGTKIDAIDVSNIKVEQIEAEALDTENSSIIEELKMTKEQLEQTSILLKQSQSEEMDAKENCEVLKGKLEEANQVLEEYKKVYDELKLDSVNQELDLIEEKKDLEKNISSLSEKLDLAITNAEQLKKDKLQAENNYSQQSIEILKIKTECDLKYEQVSLKLEEAKKSLEERKSKISVLESECNNYKNDNIKLLENNRNVEEQLALLSEEARKTVPEEQYSELDLKYQDLTIAFEKQQLKLEQATETLKEQKIQFSVMESECAATKMDYNKLSEEHNSLVERSNDMMKELEKTVSSEKYEDLVSKVAELSQALEKQQLELEITTEALKEQKSKFSELELECSASKNENAKLLEEYNCMKEKLNSSLKELEDNNTAEQQNLELLNNELETKLEDAVRCISTRDLKIDELEAKCSDFATQLKSSAGALEEQKSSFDALSQKCVAYETEITCLSEKYSTLRADFDNINAKSGTVEALNKELQTKLEESTRIVEDQKFQIDELENKCNELDSKLDMAADSPGDQNSKVEELSIEATTSEEDKLKMQENEEKNVKQKSNLETNNDEHNVKEMIDDLTSQLNKCNHLLESEKRQFEELKDKFMKSNMQKGDIELKHKSLSEEFTVLKQELGVAKQEIENLAKDKSAAEFVLQKYLAEFEESDSAMSKMKSELEKSNQTVETQKLKIDELENKCEDFNKMKTQLEEDKDISDNLKSQIELLENQCLESKAQNSKLSENCKYLEKILDSVNEKFDVLNIDYEQLKSEKINLDKSHATSISEIRKTLESAENKVEELEETLKVCKDEKTELEKELKNLASKSLAEEQVHLLSVLGKCELYATNKIKTLHSSCLNNNQEISDLKRQVKEKETSIDQLEKAIQADQKVKKENEAKMEKQISGLKHQHNIEIEEVMHLKRISEQEIAKLKSALAQKNNEEDTDDSVKSKTNKIEKKKTASKEEEDEDSENIGARKRRRPLRTQQAKAFEEDEELIVEEEDKGTESKPSARTRKRQKCEDDSKPVPKRNARKKIAEHSENMSPVQKAISYVGAKFRSVAQTVSSVPSPRVTRGRKKLFNVEAGPSSIGAKWKL